MADLEDFIFGTGSLYNPKSDPRYADITGPQKEFNFASEWNKGMQDYQGRALNDQRIEANDVSLENSRRKKKQDQDIVEALANTRSEDEVESVLRSVYAENGDADALLQLEERSKGKRAKELDEIKQLQDMGMAEAALARYEKLFGSDPEVTADKFRKKPDRYNTSDGIISIDSQDNTKVLYRTQKKAGSTKYKVVYDQYNNEIEIPVDQQTPIGYTRKPKPKSTDQIEAEAAAKIRGQMQGLKKKGNASIAPKDIQSPSVPKVVVVRPKRLPNGQ